MYDDDVSIYDASGAQRIDVDLVSDTTTCPTQAMREAMANAEVGDEQRGEDPTVRRLEERVAKLLGTEAALFVPTGTMCNIISLFVHLKGGGEVILHRDSHVRWSENGGAAVHAGASFALVDGSNGWFTGDTVLQAVQPQGLRHPRSRVVLVENTNTHAGGTSWPIALLNEVLAASAEAGLISHLDGARLLNASVAMNTPPSVLASRFDSAWIDLSKGLGCPAGAVLAGSEGFIAEALWTKHLFGGALRQAGFLAAAGLYALDHNVDRLADDHDRAERLAQALDATDGLEAHWGGTNIVFVKILGTGRSVAGFAEELATLGIRCSTNDHATLRAVTHLGIDDAGIEKAVAAFQEVAAGRVRAGVEAG
jgi:threonine aldolase